MNIKSSKGKWVFAFLVILGTFRAAADMVGLKQVAALGAATNVSPAMKVFTAHQGYETHSSEFQIELRLSDGSITTATLTPELYSHLQGPYNRRNVYGAALAYGPLLANNPQTQDMFHSVSQYALCTPGTLISELLPDIKRPLHTAVLTLQPRNPEATEPSVLEVHCE